MRCASDEGDEQRGMCQGQSQAINRQVMLSTHRTDALTPDEAAAAAARQALAERILGRLRALHSARNRDRVTGCSAMCTH